MLRRYGYLIEGCVTRRLGQVGTIRDRSRSGDRVDGRAGTKQNATAYLGTHLRWWWCVCALVWVVELRRPWAEWRPIMKPSHKTQTSQSVSTRNYELYLPRHWEKLKVV